VDQTGFKELVFMPQFDIDSKLLDYLMSIYDVQESRFYVATKLANFFFGVSTTDIGHLIGLPHHGDDVVQLTTKALLREEDKIYLEEVYNIQIDNPHKLFTCF